MYPKVREGEVYEWWVRTEGKIATVTFHDDICAALLIVKRNSFPVENRMARYSDMWQVRDLSESPQSEWQVFFVQRRYNYNCFRQDFTNLVSQWLEEVNYKPMRDWD